MNTEHNHSEKNVCLASGPSCAHGCGCGNEGFGHGHHHMLKMLIKIAVLIVVFLFAFKMGELKGMLESGHRGMFERRVYSPMMYGTDVGGEYGPGVTQPETSAPVTQ
jgi:hypothetical protein